MGILKKKQGAEQHKIIYRKGKEEKSSEISHKKQK
ncbi:MAG: hypothetical protein BTN85_2033 [Candidatus Methanohalarchaeum thermophilum]|uniref:Uncharacterized protein n=1 Tax=Methanohalarchaeum thermophilum TaxID=1903181 RepID=A0A1Q6DSQ8_METT1|nr:MAG: hypothetical protein BTN85_2033 [Candidatus Methanohalarchaeum thermophilum]